MLWFCLMPARHRTPIGWIIEREFDAPAEHAFPGMGHGIRDSMERLTELLSVRLPERN